MGKKAVVTISEVAPEQQQLPGNEKPVIPEIEEAGIAYFMAIESRANWQKQEKSRGDHLIDVMESHEIDEYSGKKVRVFLVETTTKKAKVRMRKGS